jgi:cysteine-rich repeat protein
MHTMVVKATMIAVLAGAVAACTFDPIGASLRADNDNSPRDAADGADSESGAGDALVSDVLADASASDDATLDAETIDARTDEDSGNSDGPPSMSCGDGKITGNEQCDDGNATSADGCSACLVEPGYVCAREPSRCLLESDTSFVDSSTTACAPGPACGFPASPCCTIESAVAESRPFVFVRRDRVYVESGLSIGAGRVVEIVAEDGAVLEGGAATALEVRQGADVIVRGLHIRGLATAVEIRENGTHASFFDCRIGPSGGFGFDIRNGTTIQLERNVVISNATGGVRIDTDAAAYRIVNNIVVENGAAATEFGGIFLKRYFLESVVANNTVVGNHVGGNAQAGAQGGIRCDAAGVQIVNSIIWNNQLAEGTPSSISAECDVRYSDLGPVSTATTGTNFSLDPLFVPDGSFRISASSPCIDRGDPGGTFRTGGIAPDDDIDGDQRPLLGGVDVGADELR